MRKLVCFLQLHKPVHHTGRRRLAVTDITFQFADLPIHQLMRRTLFSYIGLFSTTLVVVLVTGAIRWNILRVGRPAFQVLFGRGENVRSRLSQLGLIQ